MTFFFVAIKVLILALCVGAAVSVIVYIPLTIYVIPYVLWVGSQNTRGKQLDKKKESVFRSARNATKLYKSWILRKEPTF